MCKLLTAAWASTSCIDRRRRSSNMAVILCIAPIKTPTQTRALHWRDMIVILRIVSLSARARVCVLLQSNAKRRIRSLYFSSFCLTLACPQYVCCLRFCAGCRSLLLSYYGISFHRVIKTIPIRCGIPFTYIDVVLGLRTTVSSRIYDFCRQIGGTFIYLISSLIEGKRKSHLA